MSYPRRLLQVAKTASGRPRAQSMGLQDALEQYHYPYCRTRSPTAPGTSLSTSSVYRSTSASSHSARSSSRPQAVTQVCTLAPKDYTGEEPCPTNKPGICCPCERNSPTRNMAPQNGVQLIFTPASLLGQLRRPEERPNVSELASLAFEFRNDYATILAYADAYEEEHSQAMVESMEAGRSHLRTMKIPGAGDRRYLGFIEFSHTQHVLQTGDRLEINFDPEDETWESP
ncbi:uncharacterized protein BO97DRAFT_409759 [Aspergillus homomorphus CBS 101889]|uniref:Uncharacterized protein n=1 Tax=Aspergillus homomorphus (strain CBS 101889) TaxID=1450537 RepID=A0A395IAR0_ASPHC|nr:hypothetical protein BO97DRAFT_409759 [Aspergillus homomorphus CBS 101889]RAL17302.1 hypothetical protein BO97DRAFT_409759 [Aspergillus homomorphus CBS 101889]